MEPHAPNSEFSAKRVMVVDDNEDIRNLITLILKSESYEVLAVSSGAELMAEVKDFSPQLVLLDIMMPHMSGFEALEAIRSLPDALQNSIPVLMITAKSMETDLDRAIELGANSYIVKPFRAEALKEKVGSLLRQRDGE